MTPSRSKNRGASLPIAPPVSRPVEAVAEVDQPTRKPWKKKTPVEIFRGQVDRLREDVQEKEAELNQAKKQLQKLEEAIRLLESV